MTPVVRVARYPGPAVLWAVWTAVACLAYLRHYLAQAQAGVAPQVWPEILEWLACFYPWIVLSPVVFRLENRFPAENVRNLGILAGASVLFAGAWIATHTALSFAAPQWFGPAGGPLGDVSAIAFEISVYAMVVAAAYAWRRLSLLHEREREMARLEASLREAELEALRMRLNPHFLFNALQNISALVESEPRTAHRMLARLGDFLRAALRREAQNEVTLEAELGLAEAYLEVERVRFGDRLTVEMEIADATRQSAVPALLLQPLVENAIRHGLQEAQAGSTIRVRSERSEAGDLVLRVFDNGAGPKAESLEGLQMGVGLGSAAERLLRLYPRKHEISIHRVETGGTEVRVTLPFRPVGGAMGCAS